MPVCALNDAARFFESARNFRRLGIADTVPSPDFVRVLSEMRVIQDKIAGILEAETREAGVNIVRDRTGRLEGEKVFAGEEELQAENVIVATGSRPNIPDIPGIALPGVYNPHTLGSMQQLPRRITIIGGGVMAAEFAYIFSRLGSEVAIASRTGFLKGIDPHLRSLAIRELDGVKIRENIAIRGIQEEGSRVAGVEMLEGGVSASEGADAVLVAAGLVPRSGMISGVRKGPAGEILVDEHMRTSVPGVYACGDVIGPPYLTPVARHQGIVAADNILGRDRVMDCHPVPQSINLAHELAFCLQDSGESASLAIPGPVGPGTFWSVPRGDTGLAKILADPGDGRITGVCSAGPGGGLIAGYMAFLMQEGISVHDFEDFIEVHPSTDGVYGLAKCASVLLKKRKTGL
jgi:dihydrolipoamide dehydrogenase